LPSRRASSDALDHPTEGSHPRSPALCRPRLPWTLDSRRLARRRAPAGRRFIRPPWRRRSVSRRGRVGGRVGGISFRSAPDRGSGALVWLECSAAWSRLPPLKRWATHGRLGAHFHSKSALASAAPPMRLVSSLRRHRAAEDAGQGAHDGAKGGL
jgi:hypothetical protein